MARENNVHLDALEEYLGPVEEYEVSLVQIFELIEEKFKKVKLRRNLRKKTFINDLHKNFRRLTGLSLRDYRYCFNNGGFPIPYKNIKSEGEDHSCHDNLYMEGVSASLCFYDVNKIRQFLEHHHSKNGLLTLWVDWVIYDRMRVLSPFDNRERLAKVMEWVYDKEKEDKQREMMYEVLNSINKTKPPISHSLNYSNENEIIRKNLAFLLGINKKRERIMSSSEHEELVNHVHYLVTHDKVPAIIKPYKQLGTSAASIRFAFYNIHKELFTTNSIRDSFIDFLHQAFLQFKNCSKATTRRHFSSKPVNF